MSQLNSSLSSLLLEDLKTIFPADVGLTPDKITLFEAYFDSLIKWNKRVRLISASDESRIVTRHVVESLALMDFDCLLDAMDILDLGSGAGFPGIPLKIMLPDKNVTLLDSKRMKILFLKDLAEKLRLPGLEVLGERAESLGEKLAGQCDCVLARAVASMTKLWRWSAPLLRDEGCLLAQKGGEMQAELNELQREFPNLKIERLNYADRWPVDPSRFVVAVYKS